MDIRNDLRVGDRLDIQFGSVQYRFKVAELRSAETLIAAHLGSGKVPESYGPGYVAQVYGYSGNGRIEFEARLAQRDIKVSNMSAMELVATSGIRTVQRRSSYRLPINFPLKYLVLSKEGKTSGKIWKSAMAINLGDGGIMLSAEEGYSVGTEMQLRFALEGKHLLLNGIVRRSDFDVTPEGSLNFVMGLEFTSGNQEAKHHIARFVMQCQISKRNRTVQ